MFEQRVLKAQQDRDEVRVFLPQSHKEKFEKMKETLKASNCE
ncbi:hypothetical protein OU792_10195 [Algoriphagus sp. NF]|nr:MULTISPECIES: hypothetical protein [Algoriphagus]MDE0560356.1 hypothetical protein [Algoriphagus sp. NF]